MKRNQMIPNEIKTNNGWKCKVNTREWKHSPIWNMWESKGGTPWLSKFNFCFGNFGSPRVPWIFESTFGDSNIVQIKPSFDCRKGLEKYHNTLVLHLQNKIHNISYYGYVYGWKSNYQIESQAFKGQFEWIISHLIEKLGTWFKSYFQGLQVYFWDISIWMQNKKNHELPKL